MNYALCTKPCYLFLSCKFSVKKFVLSEKSRTFALINPTTLLVRKTSAPGWDFVFIDILVMRYIKQTMTLAEQIRTLQVRGLIIENVANATQLLERISYFRLADYWRPLEIDKVTHQFETGSCFSDVVTCYNFDKELKVLLFSAIQTIEVAVRAKVIKYFS